MEAGGSLWSGRRRGDGRGGGFRLALDMAGGFPGGEDFVVAFVDLAEDGVEGFDGALSGAEGGGDAAVRGIGWIGSCADEAAPQIPETRIQRPDKNMTRTARHFRFK